MSWFARWLQRRKERSKARREERDRPRRWYRPVLERLEERMAPVVGASSVPPAVQPGTGFDGVVYFGNALNQACTGALLTSGRHILTAAHCLDENGDMIPDQAPYTVFFDMPTGRIPVPVSKVFIHPGWEGSGDSILAGNDLGILELPAQAPLRAERYDIYRGSNEVTQFFRFYGYGFTGVGAEGEDTVPQCIPSTGANCIKRMGRNVWDFDAQVLATPPLSLVAPSGNVIANRGLAFDFDDGTFAHDAFGSLYGNHGGGLGDEEAGTGRGDSGGPAFLNGKIAGIASFRKSPEVLFSPDIDSVGNGSFGEIYVHTRVSQFASWIDGIVNAAAPLVLEMTFQPGGTNGVADTNTISVRWGSSTVELTVNGFTRSFRAASVTQLVINGSGENDNDNISINRNVALPPVVLDGRGGNDSYTVTLITASPGSIGVNDTSGSDTLTVKGTTAGDTLWVFNTAVFRGPAPVATVAHVVNYAGIDSLVIDGGIESAEVTTNGNDTVSIGSTAVGVATTVNTGSGNDIIQVAPNFAADTLTVSGGSSRTGQPPDFDLLVVNDSSDTVNTKGAVNVGQITGLGNTAPISYIVEGLVINLGKGNDLLDGTSSLVAMTLRGGAGNDTLYGGSGNDYFEGGAGSDTADGGSGADTALGSETEFLTSATPVSSGIIYRGTDGDDLIHVGWDSIPLPCPPDTPPGTDCGHRDLAVVEINGEQFVTEYDKGGTVFVFAGKGNDTVTMDETAGTHWRAEFIGGAGDDELIGSGGNDRLEGGRGNDVLVGAAGDDKLIGGTGNDVLRGTDGNDLLAAGLGSDTVNGGLGRDRCLGAERKSHCP